MSRDEHEEATRRLKGHIEKYGLNPQIIDDWGRGQIDVSYPNDDGTWSVIPLDAAHESYKIAVDEYEYVVYHVFSLDPFSPYAGDEDGKEDMFMCFWCIDWSYERDEQDWILGQILQDWKK